MSEHPYFVNEKTPSDRFENEIREFGVVAACEWFGHHADSEFTKETMRILLDREKVDRINESLKASVRSA